MNQKLQKLIDWLEANPTAKPLSCEASELNECRIHVPMAFLRVRYAGSVVRRRVVDGTAHYSLFDDGIQIVSCEPVDAIVSSEVL